PQATRAEVFAFISDDLKKRVVGVENPAIDVPGEDRNGVGVDHTAELPFSFPELAIQATVLERNRRLRGEHLQSCRPGCCEDMRSQAVLEVEQRDEPALLDEG